MLSHPPAHAVVLTQRLRQHGAYPGAVEFLFDEVWVCDGADAAHEEHLGIVQHAAERMQWMRALWREGGDDWSWYHAGGGEQDSADDETIQQADVIHSAGVAFRSVN